MQPVHLINMEALHSQALPTQIRLNSADCAVFKRIRYTVTVAARMNYRQYCNDGVQGAI